MDIRWLQDFLTVAETGNFTRAAQLRNVSQAALSRRIQSLEAWLGVALIDRSAAPTRLTPEGERFRENAGEALRQLLDAKAELGGGPARSREHLRLALPYGLATSRLSGWWLQWSRQLRLSGSVTVGNVHDLVSALVSDNVDLMVCYHSAVQPIMLDTQRFARVVVAEEWLRPYASRERVRRDKLALPEQPRVPAARGLGNTSARPGQALVPPEPLPLLMYSRDVYFARLVNQIVESAPQRLHGVQVLESDMADVLCDMAAAGFGVAWLPDSTAARRGDQLVALGGRGWSLPLSIVAYRDQANDRRALTRLWSYLVADAAGGTGAAGDGAGAGAAGAGAHAGAGAAGAPVIATMTTAAATSNPVLPRPGVRRGAAVPAAPRRARAARRAPTLLVSTRGVF